MLQFNGALLGAGWLARHCSPVQILVLRKPMDVWKSFSRFAQRPFETYLSIVLGQNGSKFPFTQLPTWLDVPEIASDTFDKECIAYAPFADANQEFMYASFFDFYVTAALHCVQFCDCILDLDGITQDARIREAVETRLAQFGINKDLRDCALPGYPAETYDEEWNAYERFARKFVAKKLPCDLTITGEMLAANQALLSEYFRELLSHFVQGRAQTTAAASPGPKNLRDQKHAAALRMFDNRSFSEAADILGEAQAEGETGEIWNDWATAQNACRRPHLAELGFRQALRADPPEREAAGNLGVLLFKRGKYREALPLLEEAQSSASDAARPILTHRLNSAHESLGIRKPFQDSPTQRE